MVEGLALTISRKPNLAYSPSLGHGPSEKKIGMLTFRLAVTGKEITHTVALTSLLGYFLALQTFTSSALGATFMH